MITVTEGNETVTVPVRERSPESGEWEDVGVDTPLARDLAWRQLQAGQNVVGGEFIAPAGQPVTVPGPKFDWLRFSHNNPSPISIRWVILGEGEADIRDLQDNDEITIHAWDPVTERGLALRGAVAAFRAGADGGRMGGATNSIIRIEWYTPDSTLAAEGSTPVASEPYLVADRAPEPEPAADGTPDKPVRAEDVEDEEPRPIDADEPADNWGKPDKES